MLWPHSGDAAQLNSVLELDMEMLISVAQLDSVPQISSMEKAQYTQVPCHYGTVRNYFTAENTEWLWWIIGFSCQSIENVLGCLLLCGSPKRPFIHTFYFLRFPVITS